MASARWRTRDRKNSCPVPRAVPSTAAWRARRSSRATEMTDASPACAWLGSGLKDPAEFRSWVISHLQALELRTETYSIQGGGTTWSGFAVPLAPALATTALGRVARG